MKQFTISKSIDATIVAIKPAKFEQSFIVVKTEDNKLLTDYVFDNLLQAVKVGKKYTLYFSKVVKSGKTYENISLIA